MGCAGWSLRMYLYVHVIVSVRAHGPCKYTGGGGGMGERCVYVNKTEVKLCRASCSLSLEDHAVPAKLHKVRKTR